jgi:hypothetical protein
MCLLCASCSDFWVSNSATATVTVSPTSFILKSAAAAGTPGDIATVTASATTVGGVTTDETAAATWTSSAPAVVTVTGGQLSVVGTAPDSTATITATFGGQNATCSVLTFTGTAPTTIVINSPSSAVTAGQVFRVTATASLSGNSTHDISSFVSWSSNAPAIATVDANGNVTVLTTATAGSNFIITATANFASGTVTGQSTQFSVPLI